MARLGRGGFLALAVIFHLVYVYSIFDIYFVSPIVHGMKPYKVEQARPPSRRLVLFVGDGLRADKAFQFFPDPSPADPANADLTPRPLAPFLRSRVLEHGTFGVSHTRVPTESRPGHVALIAGLYEDVSAVTTGWKLNPVDFDSVFNRSRHTWSWGSPDILPMFKEGAVPGRVDADQYGEEFEDFTQDATKLDTWVFDNVKALFHSASTNSTLNTLLREDKIVFFLHLLGLDTTGHSYRPYSKEYLHNIKVVDKGVEEITNLIDNFYSDGETSYVFTADHGMSDWGSHGDGHPDNTRTPLIAWGAGVARPEVYPDSRAPGHEDGYSSDWGLDHIRRHDVDQADVAALMAYLAGLEFPVNSVGRLPLSYLAATTQEKASATLVNVKEVLEMYNVKEEQKQSTSLHYQPYPPFSKANSSVAERISAIETAIQNSQHEHAIDLSLDLFHHTLQGLRYLQTYDWLFLRALITVGYLGWITFAVTTVIDLHVLHGAVPDERTTGSTVVFSSVLIALYSFFIFEKSPLTYYAYAFFPVFFWEEVFARRKALVSGFRVLFGHVKQPSDWLVLAIQAFLFLGVVEALVQSYFHRTVFTVCYVLGAFSPLFYGLELVGTNKMLVLAWAAGCLVLSTFTLLPVVKVEDANTISAGGLLMFGAGLVYLYLEDHITARSKSKTTHAQPNAVSRILMGVQVGIILLTIIVTRSSIASIQAKKGLPLGNQVIGWSVLVASLVLPFVHRIAPNEHYLHRLVIIFLTFSPSFILLTISYEGLFYVAFCFTLLAWVRLEHAIQVHATSGVPSDLSPTTAHANGVTITSTSTQSTNLHPETTFRTLALPDLRRALFFLFFLQSGFFSTGNIASVSSFSLDAVYRLIPIFDPFSQGALLLYKLLVPFAIISAALGILNRRLGLQSSALFMTVMAVSDVMTLNFFWMVKDEGSWLDIGTTISHFVIGSVLCVFVAGLEGVSHALIRGVEVDAYEDRVKLAGGVESIKAIRVEANGAANGAVKAAAGDERPVIE
ncbi:GPI ethanolamine phosphate transferase 1 [Capronia epimyces CBS 606.96]|uniref:GPI ethanolamine phosphate transferase 1 n=1 Tax=Capronia epimyces CBS 606.96 TaxID=1182542 RepID=W9XUF2_9EURO|nr:GPI ethanolamine phosphate transferase 1 [Capronia epimyces CBS 606.96]EXJ80965.1 GPI ethanolamine phosphate transferase 1 [Capronia epimyces CBS 606.96]